MTTINRHTIARDGTNQRQRLPRALQTDFVDLDERKMEQLLEYVCELAEHINYYHLERPNEVESWSHFFEAIDSKEKRRALIQSWDAQQDQKPHFALLLAFLKLFQQAQGQLNLVKERHLDFYYREILKMLPRPAQPDRVHVLFELAKHVQGHSLPVGTLLKAKTADQSIEYRTENELIVNQAAIQQLKSVFIHGPLYDDDENYEVVKVYAAPVANSADGNGAPLERKTSHWKGFGSSQENLSDDQRTMNDAQVGFAIASPILLLGEGVRNIKLMLTLEGIGLGDIDDDGKISTIQGIFHGGFDFYLSGENKWLGLFFSEDPQGPIQVSPKDGDTWEVTIMLTLPKEEPAVVHFNPEILEGRFNTPWPVLKAVFDNSSTLDTLDRLKNTILKEATIRMNVQGMVDLLLQNDRIVVDGSSPFRPFTTSPVVGSTLYISSKEAFQKRLNYLNVRINWGDLPNFTTHYAGYPNANGDAVSQASFEAIFESLREGIWNQVTCSDCTKNYPFPLFTSLTNNEKEIPFGAVDATGHIEHLSFPRHAALDDLEAYTRGVTSGFVKITLQQPNSDDFKAFGHEVFPRLFAEQAIDRAKDGNTENIPNPPYTPRIQSLQLDYASVETMNFDVLGRVDQYFHLTPFGHSERQSDQTQGIDISLLPEFNEQAYLYIGLDNLAPPQSVSLLFQLAEGTNKPDIDIRQEHFKWYYLSEEDWVSLEPHEVLRDTTHQLRSSGIISLYVPGTAVAHNTRMPDGLHWLRLGLASDPAGVCRFIDVGVNAISAARVILPGQGHLDSDCRLPQESLKKLSVGRSAIKAVKQPYPSFGGRPAEHRDAFNTRTSERLRHKNRAINIWDYEHLVLEAFPEIHKVKCLPVSPTGLLSLVVIPSLKNRTDADFLKPRVGFVLLREIEEYVRQLTTPFVRDKIIVQNPTYDEITVHCWARIKEGYDPGFYVKQLNDELIRCLSPWAFDEMEDIHFGNQIYASEVIDYVNELTYVEVIYKLELMGYENKCLDFIGPDPTEPYSILVSNNRHRIRLREPGIDERCFENHP